MAVVFASLFMQDALAAGEEYADIATISATATITNNHLCYSDSRDIACGDRGFVVTPDGDVGIGTANPSSKLHVMDGNFSLKYGYEIHWTGVDNTIAFDSGWQSGAGDFMDFHVPGNGTASGSVLRLLENGNVGIGIAVPSSALHVSGTLRATQYCDIDGANCSASPSGGGDTDWTEGSGNVYRTSGNVGVGLSGPESPLHIEGASSSPFLSAGPASNDDNAVLTYGWTTNIGDWLDITVPSANDENGFLRLMSNGKVGIGTTTPASTLEVSGTIQIAGNDSLPCSDPDHLGRMRRNASTGRIQFCRGDR